MRNRAIVLFSIAAALLLALSLAPAQPARANVNDVVTVDGLNYVITTMSPGGGGKGTVSVGVNQADHHGGRVARRDG